MTSQKLPWLSKSKTDEFLNLSLETIGREVTFNYVASVSGCSICSLDPVSNTSTNAFCPVCSGSYWIDMVDTRDILAHVIWKTSENLNWYSAGRQEDGSCSIRINVASGVVQLVDSTKDILVDGRTMQIDKITLKGSPDVNRIIIALQEKEK